MTTPINGLDTPNPNEVVSRKADRLFRFSIDLIPVSKDFEGAHFRSFEISFARFSDRCTANDDGANAEPTIVITFWFRSSRSD